MTEIDPQPLPRIAGYEITRHLGRGGMAEVYLGTQLSLARPVAVKVLSGAPGEDTITRFEHEALTIARLDHPHIVKIYDVGRTEEGKLYFTMPYLSRGDLASRSLKGDEFAILSVVRALCSALAYAHRLGIVHRDVKPENVLFDQADRPLLADFGIALTTHDIVRVTREGSTIGSSGYMSPEQARGSVLDGRADLYSLGVVTYELLSGDLPFDAPDTLAMALAHVEQPIPRLPARLRRWQPFIDKAMAKATSERFQSAAQMQQALDAIEAELRGSKPVATTFPRSTFGLRPAFGLLAAAVLIAIGAGMLATAVLRMRGTPVPSPIETAAAAIPGGSVASSSTVSELNATNAASAPTSNVGAAQAQGGGDVATRAVSETAAGSSPPAAIGAADSTAPTPVETTAVAAPANLETSSNTAVTENNSSAQHSISATTTHARSVPDIEPFATTPDLGPGTGLRDRGGPELAFVPAARAGGVHGFALSRYEVSRAEYATFVQATGRKPSRCLEPMQPLSRLKNLRWNDPGFAQNDRHPVVCVSWNDAVAYAQWISQRTHATYRLPTRAEWVHAARSAAAGNAGVCAQGNLAGGRGMLHVGASACKSGFDRTAPVGRFKANGYGIYDLVGNVSEWTLDCKPFGIDASGRCIEHLFAGTSWRDDAGANTIEASGDADADVGYTTVGIRLLRKLESSNMPVVMR
ncbi:MAG TPA: SUMF1/EgtB/PvdO family nonheme iron enzyme [Rudaea sp.]